MSINKIANNVVSETRQVITKAAQEITTQTKPVETTAEVASKEAADASRAYSLVDVPSPQDNTKLFGGRHNNKAIANKEQSTELQAKKRELNLEKQTALFSTELFRIPKDLVFIDEIVTNAIKSGKKIKLAHIGLGANGVEPLTHLAQIQLTARKFGKSIDDVLEKVDYIDIQKASDMKHREEIFASIEENGSEYFQNLGNGFTKEDKKIILDKFNSILEKSDSKYLGKSYEDFVDLPQNHGEYDMVFCNNVFYYVGNGAKGTKYNYHGSKFMNQCFYDSRFSEVVTNLLSTLKPKGKLFFTHQPGINHQKQESVYTDLVDSVIEKNNLPFTKISQEWNTVFERIS